MMRMLFSPLISILQSLQFAFQARDSPLRWPVGRGRMPAKVADAQVALKRTVVRMRDYQDHYGSETHSL